MPRVLKLDMKIRLDGDVWNIIGLGRDDDPIHPDMVYCHLASTTRFTTQKNGKYPIQRGCYVKGVKRNL